MTSTKNAFSAAEPGLGYIYQARFALLRALDLSEDASIYIERNDDVEFVGQDGRLTLGSLKHKAPGDRLTDLSVDFWKSVRIWADHYKTSGRSASSAKFMLFSTASVAAGSFLNAFVGDGEDDAVRAERAAAALEQSVSVTLEKTKDGLKDLSEDELQDFYGRVMIFADQVRIDDIPALIDGRLRTVRREFRTDLFERLEGWWNGLVISRLAEGSKEPIRVQDVSDKLAAIADEYKSDNLPI